jgi:hypothetical protein
MTLYDKIIQLYPLLTIDDFVPGSGTILLENASDERGDYIASWRHPDYPQPTDEELK